MFVVGAGSDLGQSFSRRQKSWLSRYDVRAEGALTPSITDNERYISLLHILSGGCITICWGCFCLCIYLLFCWSFILFLFYYCCLFCVCFCVGLLGVCGQVVFVLFIWGLTILLLLCSWWCLAYMGVIGFLFLFDFFFIYVTFVHLLTFPTTVMDRFSMFSLEYLKTCSVHLFILYFKSSSHQLTNYSIVLTHQPANDNQIHFTAQTSSFALTDRKSRL